MIEDRKKKRRILFSDRFVSKELIKLHEFRQIFRDIINLMNRKKELIKFIIYDDDVNHQQRNV